MTTTTAPSQPQAPQTPPGWQVLAQRAAEVLAIETAATAVLTPFRRSLQGLMRSVMATWVRTTGGVHQQADPLQMAAITAVVLGQLDDLDTSGVAGPVQQHAEEAVRLGWEHTLTELRTVDTYPGVDLSSEIDDVTRTIRWGYLPVDPVARREIQRIETVMRARVADATREAYRLGETGRWTEVANVVARAMQAATGAERIAHWVVNYAANQGARDVAAKLGFQRVWIAERDACVVCLALSGTVSVEGRFKPNATYGRKPMPVWPAGAPLLQPPRHPWCRCRCEVWRGSVPGYTGPDLPAALRREAERSILTGWRRDSEQESVRLAAAKQVLRRRSTLPASVQHRAQLAIARGAFAPHPRKPVPSTATK